MPVSAFVVVATHEEIVAAFSRVNLDENYQEARGSLYCLSCHSQLDLPVCAACRRFIDDRVINALGKQWHVEVSSAFNVDIMFFERKDSLARLDGRREIQGSPICIQTSVTSRHLRSV